ncbi:DUF2470 domain-containing protein [Streptomyces meridianus]|uniref:DUF2470 domain-containing protein n=1 Tax=Streptomyces meridianus TaxID=2938945 RepID=A0ABT0XAP9_9ACTN|nr:DUF2470 domain-containing protein [Streptomyces meridianus]MCM2579455.1 DUF2470 domain-containing protein [Streptomyces meridianus]
MFRPGTPATGAAGTPACGSDAGQPRPAEDAGRPSAAERVRTLVESDASAVLVVPGAEPVEHLAGTPVARTVAPDGNVLLLVPGDSPAARAATHAQDDDVVAVMEVTDVAPVAVPHRIRGRARVGGWLTPVRDRAEREAGAALPAKRTAAAAAVAAEAPTAPGSGWMLLRLEVGEANIDDLRGAGDVEADEFAAAGHDPFVHHETELLQHLASAHGDLIRGLCTLLDRPGATTCAADETAVPVALNRFGLRVRFFGRSERPEDNTVDLRDRPVFDARFDFPEPVRDLPALRRALHRLLDGAARAG